MEVLYQAIVDLVSNTSIERVEQLAARISAPISTAEALTDWAKNPTGKRRLKNLTDAWLESGVSPVELTGMLRGACHALELKPLVQDVDFVWTGPSTTLVPTRKTEQALLEVINFAQRKLFLTTFVAYDVASVVAALNTTHERNVELSMLLESSLAHGGGISFDVIVRMKTAVPAATIYYWAEKTEAFAGGKVHAKVAVADEQICFVSSANLTGHAMEKNMEAGLLVKGGQLPATIHRHLQALVDTKVLKRI